MTGEALSALRERAATLADNTPAAAVLWREMRDQQPYATGNPDMDGALGQITGYVVPLDRSNDGIRTLLLVPYFGACIHAPPPTADQVVHVELPSGMPQLKAMDIVRASGRLALKTHASELAASSYELIDASLEILRDVRR